MDAIRQGLSDTLSGRTTPKHDHKASESVVTVDEIDASPKLTKAIPHTPVSNGTPLPPVDAEVNGSSIVHLAFGRVKDVFHSVTALISRLDDYDESFVKTTDLHTYLQFISDERLIHMPRRGSDWDRVLGAAQFFGLQIWSFGSKIEGFVHGGKDSASAALASCLVLLEVSTHPFRKDKQSS